MQLSNQHGEIYSKWEAVTHFFIQLQAVDDTIQVVPWQVQDQHCCNPPIAIANISQSFSNLQTYIPCLASTEASWMTRMALGNTWHPSLLLISSIHPAQLVRKMGPWLRATKQGMWPSQLPQVEQTKCIGWLLYSVPEYNMSNLQKQIKQVTGINIVLHLWMIHEVRPTQDKQTKLLIKAIHIAVNQSTSFQCQQHIEKDLFTKSTDISTWNQMCFIPLGTSTNLDGTIKAAQLTSLQACCLVHTETI